MSNSSTNKLNTVVLPGCQIFCHPVGQRDVGPLLGVIGFIIVYKYFGDRKKKSSNNL